MVVGTRRWYRDGGGTGKFIFYVNNSERASRNGALDPETVRLFRMLLQFMTLL